LVSEQTLIPTLIQTSLQHPCHFTTITNITNHQPNINHTTIYQKKFAAIISLPTESPSFQSQTKTSTKLPKQPTSSEILQQAANHIHPIQNLHCNNHSATTNYKPKIYQSKQKTHMMNPSPQLLSCQLPTLSNHHHNFYHQKTHNNLNFPQFKSIIHDTKHLKIRQPITHKPPLTKLPKIFSTTVNPPSSQTNTQTKPIVTSH
jgi:hypothetical protein